MGKLKIDVLSYGGQQTVTGISSMMSAVWRIK